MHKGIIVPTDSTAQKRMRKPRIGVIGAGYVGVAVSVGFAELGYDVVLVEPDVKRRLELNGKAFVSTDQMLLDALDKVQHQGLLDVSTDISSLNGVPFVFFCTEAVRGENGEADLRELWRVAGEVFPHLADQCCFILNSTVPIGTGERFQLWFEERGKNVEVISCPAFMREGSALADFRKPAKIILGGDESKPGIHLLRRLLSRDSLTVMITTRNEAEMIKYAANAFLATKISFINQLAWSCEAMGLDIITIARAIGLDPRIGQAFFRAGIGFGGPHLTYDLMDLIDQMQRHGIETPLLEAVQEVNAIQRRWALDQLKERYPLLEGKTIAVWGVSYKGSTKTIQESVAVSILEQLLTQPVNLVIYDPQSIHALKERWTENGLLSRFSKQIQWGSSCLDCVTAVDALLILTDWQEFVETDLSSLKDHMRTPFIIDGRNLFPRRLMMDWGFEYVSVGRKI